MAQFRNVFAASCFSEEVGIASDHAQSQLPRLPSPVSGARAKPTWSATVESSLTTNWPAEVASIHMAHLPCWNRVRFSLKPLFAAPEGPDSSIIPR